MTSPSTPGTYNHTARNDAVHAEPALVSLLNTIDAETHLEGESAPHKIDQSRADAMLARIAWSRLAEPGDGTAGALLSAVGAEAALDLLVSGVRPSKLQQIALSAAVEIPLRALEEALTRWVPRLSRTGTVSDIEHASKAGLRVVLPSDSTWPSSLDDLGEHAPGMLWVRGNPRHLSAPSLGVVGARAATGYGTHVTAEIVDGVCAAGFVIVSGAAYGIDAVAHRTALAAGVPTVAVLAGGADRPYPSAHESLLDRVSGAGAVCSEMIPGSAPTKWRFLMRNRLIAALSRATLVTEAGLRSGSLNTAGHASQLGRDVGAVPGPVTSAASAGCHRLLREYAATLVTNSQEACEMLGANDQLALFSEQSLQALHDDAPAGGDRDGAWERRVLDAIPLRGARDAAQIALRCGLPVAQVHGVLAELELLGRVRRREQPDGAPSRWSLQSAT